MIINRLARKIVRYFTVKLGVMIHNVSRRVARETLPRFANNPKNLNIDLPRRIINPERIFVGDNVSLGPGTFLNALTHYPTVSMCYQARDEPLQTFQSQIVIGNNVTATADLQIAAQDRVVIEDDVMFASNIHINDGLHGYDNVNEPYRCQKITGISPILIKKGSWIGKRPSHLYTKRKGNTLSASSKVFGTYTLAMDTVAPTIKPVNFQDKKWLSKYRYLTVKIDDQLSGISKYRATVNGEWILMEYDYKTKTLTHDFNDNIIKSTKNELKIIVTDNIGNSSTFEAIFFRK